MDIEVKDAELVAGLKRLDAAAAQPDVSFGYGALIDRHATRQRRDRRRLAMARGTASALVIALVGVSLWRFEQQPVGSPLDGVEAPAPVVAAPASQPRIVRADTYFAVAALEDHIASIDDALNDARLSGGAADVARLERARALLVDSYVSVRYAEMVSANF
ncbi:MAG TPA: hypothetical protein VEW08_00430 [Steroidobacteraceae bacterium]|nr:hypothetical protein [Steroidobacteraceae bacterium]